MYLKQTERKHLKSKEKRKQLVSSEEWDKLHIDHKIFSRNKIDRMHWSAKGRLKGQYRILIRNQMRLNKAEPTNRKCELKIHCYLKRLYDMDNLWGGLKQFIDAMTTENFIWDDNPEYLDIKEVKQFKDKEEKIIVKRLVK